MFFLHFSTYQVIVLKVADGVKELPGGYESKLTDSNNASKDNLNFYVAAEITNDPVHEDSWEFTVGDEETYGAYINKGLEVREGYIIYQRAVTNDNGVSKNKLVNGTVLYCITVTTFTEHVQLDLLYSATNSNAQPVDPVA